MLKMQKRKQKNKMQLRVTKKKLIMNCLLSLTFCSLLASCSSDIKNPKITNENIDPKDSFVKPREGLSFEIKKAMNAVGEAPKDYSFYSPDLTEKNTKCSPDLPIECGNGIVKIRLPENNMDLNKLLNDFKPLLGDLSTDTSGCIEKLEKKRFVANDCAFRYSTQIYNDFSYFLLVEVVQRYSEEDKNKTVNQVNKASLFVYRTGPKNIDISDANSYVQE